jgi:small subunit ribosomal protein S6
MHGIPKEELMQHYELTVLVKPDLENEIDATINAIKKLVTDNGGEVTTVDNWGKKRLAYKIDKEDFAVYVYTEVELPAAAPKKISDVLNISDYALRYLLVKVDEKEQAKLEASKKQSATEAEEE